ncbi:gp53-like domain-containing protein [Aeromonas jandaei]|uniref:gp53-like domain-containing protein n=1 Tax=Aeromonas jandaei TaxID=650 RepID=UPI003BA07052
MHRIDTSTAQKDKFGAGKNGFTSGDAQIGVPATEVSAEILDAIQEEIASVIEDSDSGMALDKSKNNQLATAIKTIIRSAGVAATEIARGVLKIATQSQTNTGTDDSAAITPKKLRSGFSILLAPSGYIVLPAWMGSWIMQWGSAATSANVAGGSSASTPFTFPIAFPTEAYVVLPILGNAPYGMGGTVYPDTINNTGGTFRFWNVTGNGLWNGVMARFIAIGK